MGPASTANGEDKWWSYATERSAIIAYIAANLASVGAVMVWHGDTHLVGATSAAHNTPYGGFPVYCGSPLHNVGGGRNTSTFDNFFNNSAGDCRQYGRISITDTGLTISVAFTGWDAVTGTAKVTQTDVMVTGALAGSARAHRRPGPGRLASPRRWPGPAWR